MVSVLAFTSVRVTFMQTQLSVRGSLYAPSSFTYHDDFLVTQPNNVEVN